MSRSLPAVSISVQPVPIGNHGSSKSVDYKIEALLASEGHFRRPNGRWSGGGPFYVIREERKSQRVHVDLMLYYNVWSGMTGGVSIDSATYPTWAAVRSANRTYEAQKAANAADFASGWAKTRPGNPLADVGQFIVELRDLPTLPLRSLFRSVPFRRIGHEAKRRAGFFRSLGSEYLNVVFGWKPFINDLRKMYNLMQDIDRRIAQIRRDNGRSVRRKGTVSDSSSTVQTSSNYPWPFANCAGAPPNWSGGRSLVKVTTQVERKSWFSASYMYWIQDTLDWKWEARARLALFGALPTPALLWEVMPWSWLIDWFTNVGDVMSNASVNAVDNLVADYAYIMTRERTTTTHSCETVWNTDIRPNAGIVIRGGNTTLSTTLVKETKCRVAGSPYGLGVQYSGLSAYQLGILAALGLSRSRF